MTTATEEKKFDCKSCSDTHRVWSPDRCAQIRGIDAFLEWQNEEYQLAVDKASKDLELTVIEKIGTEP